MLKDDVELRELGCIDDSDSMVEESELDEMVSDNDSIVDVDNGLELELLFLLYIGCLVLTRFLLLLTEAPTSAMFSNITVNSATVINFDIFIFT